ncbi:CPBP family intramembrane metalloprotease [Oscillatoria sp. FACHB-1407]|uniref:CPBP family intramembrane glutamic endopeptidase n=1 Tax=Oscillatoria sp. FACHB-1407 TaxID=2692847 RepID=UPI0016856EFD|nr:CPBP family intramembrane glutamic endopeptidase [Oscillatoria sp. FACHB-1407]MBD2461445.1 CPBP family intramembrane metalloprotease [Oscillatoria sp. FACHB-1407]
MAVLKQFAILFVLGSLGIVLFVMTSIPAIQQQLATLPAEVAAQVPPLWVILMLQGVQNAILLAIAILVGIFCTRPLGLRSHLLERWVSYPPKSTSFATEVKWSLGLGGVTTVVILLVNRLMEPALPPALQAANRGEANWLNTLTAMLYGGITEELLMRWGLMSLLAWAGWKLLQRRATSPGAAIYWGAIALTAVLFGLLHLPFTATIAPITTWVVIRAVLLNGIAGLAFGWLFWQYSLEAAMLAHISFHALIFVLNLLHVQAI